MKGLEKNRGFLNKYFFSSKQSDNLQNLQVHYHSQGTTRLECVSLRPYFHKDFYLLVSCF